MTRQDPGTGARLLIVNADDYGFDEEIDAGILEAHARGVVTAASCLVTGKRWPEAAGAARSAGLDCGLHVDLSWGAPVAREGVGRLAPGGRFRGKGGCLRALLLGRIPGREIGREVRAQCARFGERLGTPSHLDVHQHLHVVPAVYRQVVEAAAAAGIPFVRLPCDAEAAGFKARLLRGVFGRRRLDGTGPRTPDHFRGLGLTGRLTAEALIRLIASLPEGLTELMVHPGRGRASGAADRLAGLRERELEALCDPRVREALDRASVRLRSFADEARSPGR